MEELLENSRALIRSAAISAGEGADREAGGCAVRSFVRMLQFMWFACPDEAPNTARPTEYCCPMALCIDCSSAPRSPSGYSKYTGTDLRYSVHSRRPVPGKVAVVVGLTAKRPGQDRSELIPPPVSMLTTLCVWATCGSMMSSRQQRARGVTTTTTTATAILGSFDMWDLSPQQQQKS